MAEKKPNAEEIFQKSEDEMSEMERMMAEILGEFQESTRMQNNAIEKTETEEKAPVHTYVAPEPPVKQHRTRPNQPIQQFEQTPEKKRAAKKPSSDRTQNRKPVEKKVNDIYEADKQPKKKKSGNGGRAIIMILILLVIMVIGVIVYSRMFRDLTAARNVMVDNYSIVERDVPNEEELAVLAKVTFPPDMVFPTPEPEDSLSEDGTIRAQAPGGSIVIMSGTDEITEKGKESESTESENAEPSIVREHSYQFFKEDLNWQQAQQKCISLGGHLATVASQEELNTIIELAEANGIQKVWLGCHRENDALIWENDEQIDFYAWGAGEPSKFDKGDNVTEDYLLLWKFNGQWVYNDSRNDPIKDYPNMYSGQIGYVCEYD